MDSATYRALKPEETRFASRLQTNAILADVFDAIATFAALFAKAHGGKGKAPAPYPRPWAKADEQKIGSEPIPIKDFDNWYYGGD